MRDLQEDPSTLESEDEAGQTRTTTRTRKNTILTKKQIKDEFSDEGKNLCQTVRDALDRQQDILNKPDRKKAWMSVAIGYAPKEKMNDFLDNGCNTRSWKPTPAVKSLRRKRNRPYLGNAKEVPKNNGVELGNADWWPQTDDSQSLPPSGVNNGSMVRSRSQKNGSA
ncbi:MAG: hypothetical protein ABEI52_01750 [Halobacteriaceae archaeon]